MRNCLGCLVLNRLSRTSHLMGCQQCPGCGVWEVWGPRPPCAAGQQPHQDRKARKVSVCIQTEQHRSHFFCFLSAPPPRPHQGGRESSRSKSEKQRSLISFSLPCASPGAGLYFLSSVIISVSHLIIKTLNHLLFLSRLCLERPFVPTQRGRYFYVI